MPAASDVVGDRVRQHARQDRHGPLPVLGQPEAPRLLRRARRPAAHVRRHPPRHERRSTLFDLTQNATGGHRAGAARHRDGAASRIRSMQSRRRCERISIDWLQAEAEGPARAGSSGADEGRAGARRAARHRGRRDRRPRPIGSRRSTCSARSAIRGRKNCSSSRSQSREVGRSEDRPARRSRSVRRPEDRRDRSRGVSRVIPPAVKRRAMQMLLARPAWALDASQGRRWRQVPESRHHGRSRAGRGRAQRQGSDGARREALRQARAGDGRREASPHRVAQHRSRSRERRRGAREGTVHEALRRVPQAARRGRQGRPGPHDRRPQESRLLARANRRSVGLHPPGIRRSERVNHRRAQALRHRDRDRRVDHARDRRKRPSREDGHSRRRTSRTSGPRRCR